jgi:hypothetical protein
MTNRVDLLSGRNSSLVGAKLAINPHEAGNTSVLELY